MRMRSEGKERGRGIRKRNEGTEGWRERRKQIFCWLMASSLKRGRHKHPYQNTISKNEPPKTPLWKECASSSASSVVCAWMYLPHLRYKMSEKDAVTTKWQPLLITPDAPQSFRRNGAIQWWGVHCMKLGLMRCDSYGKFPRVCRMSVLHECVVWVCCMSLLQECTVRVLQQWAVRARCIEQGAQWE